VLGEVSFYFRGVGGEKSITLLEVSQFSPARPDKSNDEDRMLRSGDFVAFEE
jgi:hypothetical protein